MAGVRGAPTYVKTQRAYISLGNDIKNNGKTGDLLSMAQVLAEEKATGSEAVQQMAERLEGQKHKSAATVGKLYAEVQSAAGKQAAQAVSAAVQEIMQGAGITGDTAAMAGIIAKALTGQAITAEERAVIERNALAGQMLAQAEAYIAQGGMETEEGTAETDGAKYSIRYTTDNRPIVVVEENILDGIPENEWIKMVKTVFSSKYAEGIPVSGRLIKVNSITKGEFTNSKYTRYLKASDGTIYQDKLKSSNNLDEIVLATTNYINEDLNHERTDSIKEFARGDVLIQIGDSNYSAKVIVGFTGSKKMVLYDIIDFKEAEVQIKKRTSPAAMQEAGSDRKVISSNTTVAQNEPGVNSQSMQNEAKYSTHAAWLDTVMANAAVVAAMDNVERVERLQQGLPKIDISRARDTVANIMSKTKPMTATQKEVAAIGKKLGLDVDFGYVHVRDEQGRVVSRKGNKIRANAQIQGNKVTLDYDCADPIRELLHEAVHSTEWIVESFT